MVLLYSQGSFEPEFSSLSLFVLVFKAYLGHRTLAQHKHF
jgi:hypothetical protein